MQKITNNSNLLNVETSINKVNMELNYHVISQEDCLGERELWTGVVTQALLDALSLEQNQTRKQFRVRAISWFSIRNEDFLFVCECANLNPTKIIKNMREELNKTRKQLRRRRGSDKQFVTNILTKSKRIK